MAGNVHLLAPTFRERMGAGRQSQSNQPVDGVQRLQSSAGETHQSFTA
jgi:hypothetical protein